MDFPPLPLPVLVGVGALLGATAVAVVLPAGTAWLRATGWLAVRKDLLASPLVRRVIGARSFQFVARLPFVLAFLILLAFGLIGSQVPGRNLAPILTWTIWWAALILLVPILGKTWCLVCPWNALAEWVQRLTLWGVRPTTSSMGLSWPRRLRNLYPAMALFAGLTWLELGFGVTASPAATAGLGLLILVLALLAAMAFDHKPFCRYACLVGAVSGTYALFAPLELRSANAQTCRGCRTHDCVRGNRRGYGCPVSEYVATMDRNTYCILCSECVKTCRHRNVALNLRPFAADLVGKARVRNDEAHLVLVILGLTMLHGVTMTPAWSQAIHAVHAILGGSDWAHLVGFTASMGVVAVAPGLAFLALAALWRVAAPTAASPGALLRGYAYALVPVALFYHLAHNLQHLLAEGAHLVPLLSDPLGWGWDLLGTASWQAQPLAPAGTVLWLQVALVVIGQVGAVYVARHIDRRRAAPGSPGGAIPTLAMLTLYSLANLWLLAQPMAARVAM